MLDHLVAVSATPLTGSNSNNGLANCLAVNRDFRFDLRLSIRIEQIHPIAQVWGAFVVVKAPVYEAANNYSMPSSSPAYGLINFQPLATSQGPFANPVSPNGY